MRHSRYRVLGIYIFVVRLKGTQWGRVFLWFKCHKKGLHYIFTNTITTLGRVVVVLIWQKIWSFQPAEWNWIFEVVIMFCKVHIFWEGQKKFQNLHLTFDWLYNSKVEISQKFMDFSEWTLNLEIIAELII